MLMDNSNSFYERCAARPGRLFPAPAVPKAPLPSFLHAASRLAPLACAAFFCAAAAAQGSKSSAPLALRATPQLREALPPSGAALPVAVRADAFTGQSRQRVTLQGNAELRRPGLTIKADWLEYDQVSDTARARGHLRINRAGDRYTGSEGQMQVEAFEGHVLEPGYELLATGAHGQAARLDFLDQDRFTVQQGDYTTCQRGGPDWAPDWLLRADVLEIDQEEEMGHAKGAVLRFKGVPLLPLPSMSFALGSQRKSGWLPPTVGLDSTSGLNLMVPYYWNIAPNRDATVTPALMSKRGLDLAGQFRYLESDYAGEINANVLPNDRLRGRTRWGLFTRHSGTLRAPLAAGGPIGLYMNINRVSDNDFWRDFTHRGVSLSTRLLATDGGLSWSRGHFSLTARALKWQTLQDADSPIVPPYDRLPQLAARWARTSDAGALDYSVEADFTRFRALAHLTGQPNASRAYIHAQAARPWTAAWGFFTPRLQVHATSYQFDGALGNGRRSASRALPTASLDGGLIFERRASYFGRAFRQTLEPRLMYVYTPFRDQSHLPNYDSGLYDFNFATIWAANAFAGHDRVVDNNLVTFGLTTRLLAADSGAETVRLAVAQRYRFAPQRVTLPHGTGTNKGLSDVMLGASTRWQTDGGARWIFDAVAQYNLDKHESTRTTVSARYTPGEYRTVNVAWRRERDLGSQQIDLGWQWPLDRIWQHESWRGQTSAASGCNTGRWYGVGRMNYSVPDRKLVDAVLGVEYAAGCWIGRVVMSRLQTNTTSATKSLMFQLEFTGLARIGNNNPLQTLRNNIPGYQTLRDETVAPSRFTRYD